MLKYNSSLGTKNMQKSGEFQFEEKLLDEATVDIFVPKEPPDVSGIISEAVVSTNADNSSPLREAGAAESRGESNEELQKVLNSIIGIKLLGIEYGDEEMIRDAEQIFLGALIGDPKCVKLASEGLSKVKAHNPGEKRRSQHIKYLKDLGESEASINEIYSSPESLGFEHLSIVHATNHRPIRNRDGSNRIDERFSASGHARSTVHVALNAQVESHAFSSDWSGYMFIIVAPMDETIALNGNPSSLIGHDTWWEVPPGHGLKLPDSTIIIKPGATRAVQYFPESKEVRYKNQGITKEDADELLDQASDYELSLISKTLGIKLNLRSNHNTAHKLKGTGLDQYETALSLEQRLEITDRLRECIEHDKKRGVAAFTDLAKRIAVRIALEAQGREVIEPLTIMEGDFKSGDISEDLRKLSLKHNTGAGHHSESTVGGLERMIANEVVRGKFIGDEQTRKNIAKEIRENIEFIGISTLQMYYRLGLI